VAELKHDRPWRLALIIGDPEAIRVATAFYALPKRDRRDLDRLAELAGVEQDVGSLLARLEAAGVLQDGEPPAILEQMINLFVGKHLK